MRLCASMNLPVFPIGPGFASEGEVRALRGPAVGELHQPLVVASEAPILPAGDLRLVRVDNEDSPRETLRRRLLTRLEPTVILAGHLRATARARGTALQLTTGPIAAPPHECALVEVRLLAAGTLSVSCELVQLSAPRVATEGRPQHPGTSWFFDGVEWVEELQGAC